MHITVVVLDSGGNELHRADVAVPSAPAEVVVEEESASEAVSSEAPVEAVVEAVAEEAVPPAAEEVVPTEAEEAVETVPEEPASESPAPVEETPADEVVSEG